MAVDTSIEQAEQNVHPSTERIKHLRHQIRERMPEARKVFNKSGTEPTERELINQAGEKLRNELESDYDVLTEVFNKRGYEKGVLKATRAHDKNSQAAVAVIDLDNLKTTNDTLGHTAGDKYIKDAAEALIIASRDTDVIGRLGGDEFQVFLANTNPELAETWKQRVTELLAIRGVNASIGLSSVDLNNIGESVKNADSLMYIEKRSKKKQPGKIIQFINRVKNLSKKAA